MLPLLYVVIFAGYYLFTLLMLRLTLSQRYLPIWVLLISLLAAQFCLKLVDRYYFAAFALRAGDEIVWLRYLTGYQATGNIPMGVIAQGTGIFYFVAATATIFHVNYGSALVGLAIALGTVYVVPVFLLYRVLFQGDDRLAFVSTLLVSMSDVLIYSTTIARPTLLGLFFLPLAVATLQLLRGRFRWSTFIILLILSIMILFVHAPITFLVLLAAVSSVTLLFDKVRKWEIAYVMFLFISYGVTLRLLLPDLDRIWRNELFGGPLSQFSGFMGVSFYLIFPMMGAGVLVLAALIPRLANRIEDRGKSLVRISSMPLQLILGLILLAALTSVFVWWKYAAYISEIYGGLELFLLLQGWKLLFGSVALLGLWRIGARYKRESNDTALAWLLAMAVIVALLAAYTPLTRFYGLSNLDERFAEFAYYPGFYFVTVGLDYLATRCPGRMFKWLAMPVFALYTIPSIIVGTQILSLLRS